MAISIDSNAKLRQMNSACFSSMASDVGFKHRVSVVPGFPSVPGLLFSQLFCYSLPL